MRTVETSLMYTLEEACQITRLSRATVYRAIEDGRLEAVRLGILGPWRIRRESLAPFLPRPASVRGGSR